MYLNTETAEDEQLIQELTITLDNLQLLEQSIEVDELNWREASSEPLSEVEFSESMSP